MEREDVYILCDLHGFDLLKFEASLKSQFLLLLLESCFAFQEHRMISSTLLQFTQYETEFKEFVEELVGFEDTAVHQAKFKYACVSVHEPTRQVLGIYKKTTKGLCH